MTGNLPSTRVAVSQKGTTVPNTNPRSSFVYSDTCNCITCQDIRRLHAGHATPSLNCALCQQIS
jgi:hypothetical protein